jgi:hypothetical protein
MTGFQGTGPEISTGRKGVVSRGCRIVAAFGRLTARRTAPGRLCTIPCFKKCRGIDGGLLYFLRPAPLPSPASRLRVQEGRRPPQAAAPLRPAWCIWSISRCPCAGTRHTSALPQKCEAAACVRAPPFTLILPRPYSRLPMPRQVECIHPMHPQRQCPRHWLINPFCLGWRHLLSSYPFLAPPDHSQCTRP